MRKFVAIRVLVVSVVVALGLGAATAAALGAIALAIALLGVGLAAMAVLLLILERRTQAAAGQTRRSVNRMTDQVQRIETLVDAMQRRVVASVESARVEAAERHRASVDVQ
ncbi:hypothetical protein ACTU3I_11755 [Microbacterium sp. RD1]|uniref:hypothetical protein n=1 Tax=Microbacterium sp. RD1 TaxID=3457313 RepID=UPI003FA5E7E3